MPSVQTCSSDEEFPVFREKLAEAQPPAVDSRLHRTERGLGHRGDLVVVHPVDVAEDDGGPLVRRQHLERALEVAAMTQSALGTVKSRIHRGRLRLRELLAEHRELFTS